MNSDQRDDRDRYESDDRRREDDDRPRRRRSRDDDDYDDRPRRRSRDDDYDRRPPRRGSNSTLIIVLCVVGVVVVGGGFAMYFAVQKVREAARRAVSQNNLKEMGLGYFNYASAHGDSFPAPAICDKNGKPLLSWRVAILPYVEQGALFLQFKLDEPWDSPNNIKLLSHMPKIYAPPGNVDVANENKTFYRAFYRKGEIGLGLSIPELMKGKQSTADLAMIVEAGEPVLWTKPDELEYDESKPLPPMGGIMPKSDTFSVAMFDGSVRAIRRDESEAFLRAAIRRQAVRVND